VMVGRFLGKAVGQRAEIAGGVVLVVIGSVILAEHLGYMS
jgi:manganese efflux pump family protein